MNTLSLQAPTMAGKLILLAAAICAYLRFPRLMLRHYRKMGAFPRVGRPRSFSEKFLWRKLFDRDPRIARLSDKLLVKDYFRSRCPTLRVPETLWVGRRPEDIPDELLEGSVAVKTNHGSNFNVFVENGEPERRIVNGRINHWFRFHTPYGQIDREWAYTRIDAKVFVEELLRDRTGREPLQVIVHTYDGAPEFFLVLADTIGGPQTYAAFEPDGTRMVLDIPRLDREDTAFSDDFVLPDCFPAIMEDAARLGSGFDYVRVDFLLVDGVAYANEMTFYTNAGYPDVEDPAILGRLTAPWDLRKSWFLTAPQTGWRRLYADALRASL